VGLESRGAETRGIGMSLTTTGLEKVGSRFSLQRKQWFVWLVKSCLAIIEQALIAGSNFLLNVLVVRWLTAAEYGAYAVAFAVYMLLIGCYQGLILEPMAVLSASYDDQQFRSYFGSLLRVQAWISAALAFCLILIVLVLFLLFHQNAVAWTLLGLVPSLPFILVFFLLRGACYVRRSPQHATQAAFVYSCVMLSGLVLVSHWSHITGFMVFIGMGLAAAAVSCVLLTRLRPDFHSKISDREQWLEHWNFGRWELSKIGFDWLSQNISYTFTAGFMGMAQVGALKAINTLFIPLGQTMSALRRLFLPHLAMESDRKGHSGAAKLIWRMALVYLAGGLVYGVAVSLAAKPLFHLLYAGKFMEFAYLVSWMAIAAPLGLPAHVIDMGLRSIRSPKSIFTVSCLSSIICVCITMPLTWLLAIRGAVASSVISTGIMLVIISVIFRRKTRSVESNTNSVVLSTNE
jgi:O-antigen/teichoic acid export membrane protein